MHNEKEIAFLNGYEDLIGRDLTSVIINYFNSHSGFLESYNDVVEMGTLQTLDGFNNSQNMVRLYNENQKEIESAMFKIARDQDLDDDVKIDEMQSLVNYIELIAWGDCQPTKDEILKILKTRTHDQDNPSMIIKDVCSIQVLICAEQVCLNYYNFINEIENS